MKQMSEFYMSMSTADLRRLMSKKHNQVMKLESKNRGYFEQKELIKLRQQLVWGNAVLASRQQQLALPF